MPHRRRQRQIRQSIRRRVRQRRAIRNQRLRQNRRRNRFYGPARRSVLLARGLPVYPIMDLLHPPVPLAIHETEWNERIAHDVERGSWSYFEHWRNTREVVGDIMEHQFRLNFPIPVHLPRNVMKLVLSFVASEDSDELWGCEGMWIIPIEYEFNWPRPFRWPRKR